MMTEAEFYRELDCGKRLLNSSDPLSLLIGYQALERCRNYVTTNNRTDLEKLLPNGWQRISMQKVDYI